jgi:ParB family chromosome partitioning protein|tara:strand:- start:5168 stop:6451 length:1284 start_codon:yes stop_codon:yes gene_type:complete
MKVRHLKLDEIKVGKRFREDMGDIEELAASFKEVGVLQPISVDEQFNLLAGGRRVEAAKVAELKSIPAIVRKVPENLSAREIELSENVHRKDFTWHERAELEREIFQLKKKDNPDWREEDHVDYIGTSKGASSRRLRLAEAMEYIPELVDCKTQDEAWKTLKKIEEELITESIKEKADDKLSGAALSAKNHYRIGDAIEGLKGCPHPNANFIEVDPPYAVQLHKRKDRNQDLKQMDKYNEVDAKEYPDFLKAVAEECHRITADNSFLIWWFGPEWYEVVKQTLKGVGYKVGDIPAIWIKGQAGQTASPDTMLGSGYEPFFVCRKGMPKLHKAGRSNVFDFSPVPPQDKIHPTERPLDLMLEILRTFAYPGYRICVPFLGSGVTLRAAYKEKMTGWGWDKDKMTKNRFVNQVFRDQEEKEGEEDDNVE